MYGLPSLRRLEWFLFFPLLSNDKIGCPGEADRKGKKKKNNWERKFGARVTLDRNRLEGKFGASILKSGAMYEHFPLMEGGDYGAMSSM